MTLAEQLAAHEAKRASIAKQMEDIMNAAGAAGETLDAENQEKFDDLSAQLKAVDAHIERLNEVLKVQAKTAKPVAGQSPIKAVESRDTGSIKVIQKKLAPGIAFARIARVKALARMLGEAPTSIAKSQYGEDSDTYHAIHKAAVGAAVSSSGTSWAGNLVGEETSAFADFVEYLRPQTIIGKFGQEGIPALRRVPFRVPLISQTSGGAGYWVGEGKAKPLTDFDFGRTTLDPLKVANIAVVTMETIRDSSPSAEAIIRDQLAAALRARLDIDFISPLKAVSPGVSPASITNGLVAIISSGQDAEAVRADLRKMLGAFVTANNAPTEGVWIMSALTALSLSLMTNALGQKEFPGITMRGGELEGMPVITSEYIPTVDSGSSPPAVTDGRHVVLVNASDIYIADDGDVAVDMSQEASLEMSDSPSGDASDGTGASLVSLWQTNSVGFRAERTINWARRRSSGVSLLSGVRWGE